MKKTETKPKSSKADKAGGVSVSKKPLKSPIKVIVKGPAKKVEASVFKKGSTPLSAKPVVSSKSTVSAKSGVSAKPVVLSKPSDSSKPAVPSKPTGRRPSRRPSRSKVPVLKGPKPIPVHKNGPALQPSIAKSAVAARTAALIKPDKQEKKSKDKTGLKPKPPMKLVQVIPKQKPSYVPSAPVKKEKMLMRFGKPTKRVLFSIDFLLKASPTILYHFMTTPSSLVRWFCDAVDITNEYYTFSWNGNTELAELIDDIEDERLKFRWLDGEDDDEFFEFKISTADITDETILEITDFAWADEVEEQKELWTTQVEKLRKETGDA